MANQTIKTLPFLLIFSLLLFPYRVYGNNIDNAEIIKKTAYLTFDDGPSALTDDILNILKEKEVRATFFIAGKSTKNAENMLKRILEEGHTIGNHTYSHNYPYIYKNTDNFFQDFYKNEELLYDITGIRPKIVRLPGGTNNTSSKVYGKRYLMNEISAELDRKGYLYFDWNVSSRDADGQDHSVDEIVSTTLSQAKHKKNAIILFHDTASKIKTVKALPKIIDGLKKQGFDFSSLDETSFRVVFPLPKVKLAETKSSRPKITKHLLWKLSRLEELHKNYNNVPQ